MLLQAFSFVNLDLYGLGLPLGCIGLRTYHAKLLLTMIVPPVLILCSKLFGWVFRDREHERKSRADRTPDASTDVLAEPTESASNSTYFKA